MTKPKTYTLKQVAQKLDISKARVHAILTDNPDIPRVEVEGAEYGYAQKLIRVPAKAIPLIEARRGVRGRPKKR